MYIARKAFRYEDRIYLQGDNIKPKNDDVRMLQGQGKIGGEIRETATVKPIETAMKPKPEPKHVGGGWYKLEDGTKVRKKDL